MPHQTKYFLLAFSALTFCTSLFANTNSLSTNPPYMGFSAGVQALYLRPTDDSTKYAFSGIQSLASFPDVETTLIKQTERTIKPDSDFGFRIDLAYTLPCKKYDITAAYTQLNSTNTDSVNVPQNYSTNNGLGVNGPFVVLIPLNQLIADSYEPLFGSATSHLEYNLKVTDLDLGQNFVDRDYDLRLFGGLRYARLNRDLESTGFPPIPTLEHTSTIISQGLQDMQSHFKGFGPHLGMKGRYSFCRGFGVDADIEAALLVGQVDSNAKIKVSYIANYPDFFTYTENLDFFTQHSENRTVGVLEGKLGIDYTYTFGCQCQSALVLEAGYQANIYYDAIEKQEISNFTQINNGIVSNHQVTIPGGSGNFSFNGPYLGFKYYA